MGFRKNTRDVEAQGAAKKHTSKARGDGRGPGVRGSGTGCGQRWSRYQRGRGDYAYGSSGVPQEYARFEGVERSKGTNEERGSGHDPGV